MDNSSILKINTESPLQDHIVTFATYTLVQYRAHWLNLPENGTLCTQRVIYCTMQWLSRTNSQPKQQAGNVSISLSLSVRMYICKYVCITEHSLWSPNEVITHNDAV